ncbi:hypothetical protein [Paenibacillus elgii]|uniref:hypothetical protein n=1 Tax=Paenibacillus elgii TaxID=189691 RepID=UPI00203FF93B|nr:hypothetical protein [Paenibacillus elgii]MCM3272592.1 hypothetical protein [Paenibacillus elgii]
MLYVITIGNIMYKYDCHPIPVGTLLEVEESDGDRYKVIRGHYEGVSIYKSRCVLAPLCQELSLLRGIIDQGNDNKLHEKALFEALEVIAELKRDNPKERNKDWPEIPLEVAEALIVCADAGISEYNVLPLTEVIGQLFRDYDQRTLDALKVLREYNQTAAGAEKLFKALANGYRIEMSGPAQQASLDDRLKQGIRQIFQQFNIEQNKRDKELSDRIAAFVKQAYAEQSK